MDDTWCGLWMNWVFVYSNENDLSYYVHKQTKRECLVHYDPFATGFKCILRRHPRGSELRRRWRSIRHCANAKRIAVIASKVPCDLLGVIDTYL